jgi:methyl acetate hydrolase
MTTATVTHRMQETLEAIVAAGHVPGVVGVVADRSGVIFEGAAGRRNAATGDPMTIDTVFRIVSMTKLMTSVAVLQLVERGRVGLDTAVASVVPEFDSLDVLEGFQNGRPVLRRPKTAATVRHLLTHTSGLGYAAWHPGLNRFHELTGARELSCARRAAFTEVPLVADPGAEFNYSTSLDWAGLVIEAVSARTLDAYWRDEIFGPLGLTDTLVVLDDERRARTAAVHIREEDDHWNATEIDYYAPGDQPEFFAGGHCLYSGARDCLRLQRALLAGGSLDGVRILEERTVAEMFRDHLGSIPIPRWPAVKPKVTAEIDLGPGATWGLGQWVTTIRDDGLRHAGSGGWMGLFNTSYWIDPEAGRAGGFFTSTLPFFEPRVVGAMRTFERASYGSVDE